MKLPKIRVNADRISGFVSPAMYAVAGLIIGTSATVPSGSPVLRASNIVLGICLLITTALFNMAFRDLHGLTGKFKELRDQYDALQPKNGGMIWHGGECPEEDMARVRAELFIPDAHLPAFLRHLRDFMSVHTGRATIEAATNRDPEELRDLVGEINAIVPATGTRH